MDPRRGTDTCEEYFEEGEGRVETVFAGVGPDVVRGGEGIEKHRPVDDGNEEGKGGYCAEEEVMECLEWSGEAVEEGWASLE